jgi:hypothetical protein
VRRGFGVASGGGSQFINWNNMGPRGNHSGHHILDLSDGKPPAVNRPLFSTQIPADRYARMMPATDAAQLERMPN